MARGKKADTQKAFSVVLAALMEGAGGFDNIAFVRASLAYLEHRTGKPGMEALAEAMWDLFLTDGVGVTAKVRIMECFVRCLAKIPGNQELLHNVTGMSDEEIEESLKHLSSDIAREVGGILDSKPPGPDEEP